LSTVLEHEWEDFGPDRVPRQRQGQKDAEQDYV